LPTGAEETTSTLPSTQMHGGTDHGARRSLWSSKAMRADDRFGDRAVARDRQGRGSLGAAGREGACGGGPGELKPGLRRLRRCRAQVRASRAIAVLADASQHSDGTSDMLSRTLSVRHRTEPQTKRLTERPEIQRLLDLSLDDLFVEFGAELDESTVGLSPADREHWLTRAMHWWETHVDELRRDVCHNEAVVALIERGEPYDALTEAAIVCDALLAVAHYPAPATTIMSVIVARLSVAKLCSAH
jgi:hypothetical protein